jgi:hypothetical protein
MGSCASYPIRKPSLQHSGEGVLQISSEKLWNCILAECLPFNTVEKESFNGHPSTVPRSIIGLYKDLLCKKTLRY